MCVFRDFLEIPKYDVNVRFSGFAKIPGQGGKCAFFVIWKFWFFWFSNFIKHFHYIQNSRFTSRNRPTADMRGLKFSPDFGIGTGTEFRDGIRVRDLQIPGFRDRDSGFLQSGSVLFHLLWIRKYIRMIIRNVLWGGLDFVVFSRVYFGRVETLLITSFHCNSMKNFPKNDKYVLNFSAILV